MKHMLKKFFSVVALLSTVAVYGSTPAVVDVTTYMGVRSMGVDAARELSGWTQHVNLFDMDKVYGTLALTAEFTKSFRPNRIAESLFGSALNCASGCDDSFIGISGSHAANLSTNDLLADYFYLPTNFQSRVNFSPSIENVVVDLNFYLGFDEWCQGLFFRLDLPLNWAKWNLHMCENVISTSALNYDPGYFNSFHVPNTVGVTPIGIEGSKLLPNFSAYARGQTVTGTEDVVLNGLCYSRMDCEAHSTFGLADVQAIFGWNFLNDEDYHLGAGLLIRAPTGNRANGELLFQPIVGNGGSWELGAHITSHATLWRCESEESSLGFYLDANITHLFNANQTRSFDLKNKPLSRYMLAEKFQTPAVAPAALAGSAVAAVPTYQFAGVISPVANLTTQEVKVSVGCQGDLAAQFTYANGGFNWDLGYNFWGRSCEKFKCNRNSTPSCPAASCNVACPPSGTFCPTGAFAENTWGLKGDAYVYGFDVGAATLPGAIISTPATPVPLAATESAATINNGTNFPTTGAITLAQRYPAVFNSGIDAPLAAFDSVTGRPLGEFMYNAAGGLTGTADPVDTSATPVFIKGTDFNFQGTSGYSNKLYTNLSYNWVECDDWVPYLGIGAFGEWGNGGNSCNTGCNTSCNTSCPTTTATTVTTATTNCPTSCSNSCNSCVRTGLSQWGIWLKGGISFN